MTNKIICKYCGAEFRESMPKCPYCGSTNYIGAEEEYFERLEAVREDMEQLETVPQAEVKKALRQQGGFLKKIFIVIGIVLVMLLLLVFWLEPDSNPDAKEGFFWKQKNVPLMNELFEQGKYDEAMEIYKQSYELENISLYGWEHCDFFSFYETILSIHDTWEWEAEGYSLSVQSCTLLFARQWTIIGMDFADLDDEERRVLAECAEPIIEDFERRWNMSEADFNTFYERMKMNGGHLRYSVYEEYIEDWYESQ